MAQDDPSTWDFSRLDKILEKIISTPKYEVLVGWPGDKNGPEMHNPRKPHHGGKAGGASQAPEINLATLAAIHDLGLGHQYERPFVRQSVENRRDQYSKTLGAELKKAYAAPDNGPGPVLKAYGKLGAMAKAAIAIEVGDPKPPFQENKKETIERKGSDRPLVDTGQLKNSAQWVVRKAGETRK
jgi:hypothetical protein